MKLTPQEKADIQRLVVDCLKDEPEVQRIVIFGSFVESDAPNDIDVAIYQNSLETYLPLALKYRRKLRPVTARIAIDVIPLRPDPSGPFMDEITAGRVIYDRHSPPVA